MARKITSRKRPTGWRFESARHGMSAKGIKTSKSCRKILGDSINTEMIRRHKSLNVIGKVKKSPLSNRKVDEVVRQVIDSGEGQEFNNISVDKNNGILTIDHFGTLILKVDLNKNEVIDKESFGGFSKGDADIINSALSELNIDKPKARHKRGSGAMEDQQVILEAKGDVDFWVKSFEPRTEKWQKENLKRLKKEKSPFETQQEREDKIKALESVLSAEGDIVTKFPDQGQGNFITRLRSRLKNNALQESKFEPRLLNTKKLDKDDTAGFTATEKAQLGIDRARVQNPIKASITKKEVELLKKGSDATGRALLKGAKFGGRKIVETVKSEKFKQGAKRLGVGILSELKDAVFDKPLSKNQKSRLLRAKGNKNNLVTKNKIQYWSFPKGKPAPNNYVWDGKGWRKNPTIIDNISDKKLNKLLKKK